MSVRHGRRSGHAALLEGLAARTGMPVSAMLQLTARCNLRCRHCYQVERRKSELTTRQWRRALDDLASAGLLFVTLSGGEPLVRRDFFDIASHARALRFALQLKTNAYLIDRRAADRIARLAFLDVQMSLYSTRSRVHDSITGLRGSHRRLLSAARMLARRGIRVVMMTPLMSVNAGEIDELTALADREGFEFSMDPQLNVCEDGGCRPLDLRMSEEQLERVFRSGRLVDRAAVRRAARARRPTDRVCNAGKLGCVVEPTGDVLVCPLIPVPLGNVTSGRFADIWKGSRERARIDAITWADLEKCSACDLMPWCTRCHGAALAEDGSLMGPSRVACLAAAAKKRSL